MREEKRLDEMRLLSKRPKFEESESEDEELTSDIQRNFIEELQHCRKNNINCRKVYSFLNPSCHNNHLETIVKEAFKNGHILVRNQHIPEYSRYDLGKNINIREIFPGWFTHVDNIKTIKDACVVTRYLKEQYGGTWEAEKQKFIASHPLPNESSTPMLQNMRCSDFMQASMYYILKHNKCKQCDLFKCTAKMSNNFKNILHGSEMHEP